MVLADLGSKLKDSLRALTAASIVNDELLDSVLKDICKALLQADVNVKLVQALRKNIRSVVNEKTIGAQNVNKKRVMEQAIFEELVRLVDPHPEKAPWKPRRAQTNVVMFVGLQGAGKTTSVTKLASYYARRGWKAAVVAADTYRAGAFDQLKQNATKAKLPFYGSHTETDAAKVARDGVCKFREAKFELVIVDTSGRHKQEAALFEEMLAIREAVQPDHIVFVMDGTMGQAAELQARAFKEAVDIGSIILTKLDGHAKGGGALSAVAATGSPILFVGTGEHVHDFEPFRPRAFVQKMLGLGDLGGLVETLQSSIRPDQQQDLMRSLETGSFCIRDLAKQLEMVQGMGPLGRLVGMMPGMPAELAQIADAEGPGRFKRMMCVLDSMTAVELDSDGACFYHQPSRLRRVARGCGAPVQEVEFVLQMYKTFANMFKSMGGKNGLFSMMERAQAAPGGRVAVTPQQMARMNQQVNRMMPEGLLQQMGGGAGGMGGLQDMMRNLMGGGGMPGGGGGPRNAGRRGGRGGGPGGPAGGMPDLGALMRMMGGGG